LGVGSVLTAALVLVALPGLVGSRTPIPIEPVPAGAFQQLSVLANDTRSMGSIAALDDAHVSGGIVGAETRILEPGAPPAESVRNRPRIELPRAGASSVSKGALSASLPGKPKYTLSGGATFYDNGTTAMRLPRGTVVKICGKGGCIVRVVNDYGPQKKSRVVDLYRPDFFAVCGCPSYAGTTQVTVSVY
jgi:hypothetical protein